MQTDEMPPIWQPIVLVVSKRIDCWRCGAKAVLVILDDHEVDEDHEAFSYTPWCQDCWQKEAE